MPTTTQLNVRVPSHLLEEAKGLLRAERGETLSDVLVEALLAFVASRSPLDLPPLADGDMRDQALDDDLLALPLTEGSARVLQARARRVIAGARADHPIDGWCLEEDLLGWLADSEDPLVTLVAYRRGMRESRLEALEEKVAEIARQVQRLLDPDGDALDIPEEDAR